MRATSAWAGVGLALLVATAVCGGGGPAQARDAAPRAMAEAGPAQGRTVVDSALPIAEHLRRFRLAVGPNPGALQHGAGSVPELARRWARSVATNDTGTLIAMTMTPAEFAWLFYPESPLSRPPWEMPPGLLWSQLTANGNAGLQTALRRFGGRPLAVTSVSCRTPPAREGANRLLQGCTVSLRAPDGELRDVRAFGTIVERGGRFKLLSHANGL